MSITPGRATTVTIDNPVWSLALQPTTGSLTMGQIAADNLIETDNIEFIEGVGYQLAAIQRSQSYKHETSAADSGVFRPGSTGPQTGAQYAPLMLAAYRYRADTDLTGISLGSRRDNGDVFYKKQVSGANSYDDRLTADETAFPPPDISAGLVPCDRVFCSDNNHEPNDNISLILSMPDMSGISALSIIGRIYFSGIPGSTSPAPPNGTGKYCLVLKGDGRAELEEKLTNSSPSANYWTVRKTFRWCDANQIAGGTHSIKIHSDAYKDANGHWLGSTISFQFATFDQGLISNVITFANAVLGLNWTQYSIPQTVKAAPKLDKLRFDLRRNVRAELQFHKHLYRDSGTLKTVLFQLSQPASGANPEPIEIRWFGAMPGGMRTSDANSSIDVMVYGQDGTACTPIGAISNTPTRGARKFQPINGEAGYYAIFTYTPDGSKTKTPFINRVDFGQAGTLTKSTTTATTLPKVTAVTISGQDADPGHESIGVVSEDLYEAVPQLGYRGGMPIKVEVDLGGGVKSVLGNGFVAAAPARVRRSVKRAGRQGSTTTQKWHTWSIKAQGEHAKLSRLQAPFRIDLMKGSDSGGNQAPYKITDILKLLFANSGYASWQYDIPDLPISYLNDGRLPLFIEPFTELYPLMILMIREYLGGYLVWDPNSSTSSDPTKMDGCWRVKIPPRPKAAGDAYNYLAHFRTDQRLSNSTAYDTLSNGQIVKKVGINREGFFPEVEKPEANIVTVYGVGYPDKGGILAKSAGVRIQIPPLPNWVSAEFGQSFESTITKPVPDPTHPDYLGYVLPLYYSDPGINSVALAQLIQYRLYDMTCHAKKKFRFEAPLVLVTDITDANQRQPRKLMYGDPVLLNGSPVFVESCHVDVHGRRGGDRMQMASYELFTVPALTDYSALITSRTD